MIKKIVFSLAALIVFAILFTSCNTGSVPVVYKKTVSFDTTISVPSCPVPILTNIYNCTTHKKSGEKVIGWESAPNKIMPVHMEKEVFFNDSDAQGVPIPIQTTPVTNEHWYNDGTWFMNGIGWLILLLLLIALLVLAGDLYTRWKRNQTPPPTNTKEGVTPHYAVADTKAMLEKILATGGHIDHKINRDSETFFVKVEPPVAAKKSSTKPADDKKESDQKK